MAATFGPVFGNFGRFSPIEIPVRPGRTVVWRHGATWLGQTENPVTEWSFGPEEENDLLAKLRRLADFQGWGVNFENFALYIFTMYMGRNSDRPTVDTSL